MPAWPPGMKHSQMRGACVFLSENQVDAEGSDGHVVWRNYEWLCVGQFERKNYVVLHVVEVLTVVQV